MSNFGTPATYGWIPLTAIVDQLKTELKTLNERGRILVDDCITFGVSALRDIGTPAVFDSSWTLVKIHNHRGIMPNDVYQVDRAYFVTDHLYHASVQPIITTEITVTAGNELYNKIISTAIPLKYSGSELKLLTDEHRDINISMMGEQSFILQGRTVITSFSHGYVMMLYDGLYLDNDGIPMCPDDIDMIHAVKAYMRYKLFEEAAYMQEEGAKGVFEMAATSWYEWRAKAQNSSLLISISEAVERVNETANRYWKFKLPLQNFYQDPGYGYGYGDRR